MRAYLTEGELMADADTLVRLAVEVGLPEDDVRALLDGDRFADDVRDDERTGAALGIQRCPVLRRRPPVRRVGRAAAGGARRAAVARLGGAAEDRGRHHRRQLRHRRLLTHRRPRRCRLGSADVAERRCDILVAGGGLGGVAAALAATARGHSVVLTEPTDWLGGQLTSQAVPPDEHRWIERHGCTRVLPPPARRDPRPLPGALSAHARRAARAGAQPRRLHGLAARPRAARRARRAARDARIRASPDEQLTVLLRHTPVRVATTGDRVDAVTLEGPDGEVTVWADWILDATETGALLPLAGAEHVTGFESRERTGEPHAPAEDQPGQPPAGHRLLRARAPRGRGPHDRPARRVRALRGPVQLGRARPADQPSRSSAASSPTRTRTR